MKLQLLFTSFVLSAALVAGAAEASKTPKVGDKAPLVTGKDQSGATVKLADALKHGPVLLYFYPKDNT
ncbi:MAG TPA: redoxin domain-containing protein, partial [Verrucomicrobiae bacterium]